MTTAKRSLFDIGEDFLKLEDMLESLDGDISDPAVEEFLTNWLTSLGTEQAAKFDNYINLLRKWEAEASAARAEADRYIKAKQIRENRVDRLKIRLKQHMEDTNQLKVETPTGRVISIQKNGGKLPLVIDETVDPAMLPTKFQRVELSVDTAAVRESLDSGTVLEWARLGERGTSLRIK